MGIDVGRGAGLGVAQLSGYHHQRYAVGNHQGGVCVPLWHNKDKSESPCGARS